MLASRPPTGILRTPPRQMGAPVRIRRALLHPVPPLLGHPDLPASRTPSLARQPERHRGTAGHHLVRMALRGHRSATRPRPDMIGGSTFLYIYQGHAARAEPWCHHRLIESATSSTTRNTCP